MFFRIYYYILHSFQHPLNGLSRAVMGERDVQLLDDPLSWLAGYEGPLTKLHVEGDPARFPKIYILSSTHSMA